MDVSLKESHPQKYYIKIICRILYFLGLGDVWYEDMGISYSLKNAYNIWAGISNFFILIGVVNQYLAFIKSDLSEKEQNDLFQSSIGHSSICAKVVALYVYKDSITRLLENLLETTRSIYFDLELENKSKNEFFRYCMPPLCLCYSAICAPTVGAILAYYRKGIPINIKVVYYPDRSDSGYIAVICRLLVSIHWYWIVSVMLVLDCLTLCCLIVLGYKFKIVQKFFEKIASRIEENTELNTRKEKEEAFIKEFVVGMAIHKDTISVTTKAQVSLGPLYGIQISEGVYLIVLCLIKLASGDRTLVHLLGTMCFIGAVVVITGSYMIAAGNITHEADLVPTVIFHCGWEKYTLSRKFRTLAVVALQCGQFPVIMTAFGVIPLSYSSFISILRSSYSFFACVY